MRVPNEALTGLKCNICTSVLSCFPIYEHLILGAVCGRCKLPPNDAAQAVRNVTYETAAKFFKFPCRYYERGCLEELFPADVIQHENSCCFMTIDCPMKLTEQCKFHGSHYDLLAHFEEKHPTFILQDGKFEVDFINTHEKNYLVPFGEDIFLCNVLFESNVSLFSCSVLYAGFTHNAEHFKYKLILEKPGGQQNMTFEARPTIAQPDQNHVTEVTVASVIERLEDPTLIIGRIEIVEDNDLIEVEKKVEPSPRSTLKNFECPICFEYMVPPVYQCVTGHVICSTCKPLQRHCPSCQQPYENTRNFFLEQLLEQECSPIFPCKNNDAGCGYSAKILQIKEHEKFCIHSLQECPVKDYDECKSQMPVNKMYSHVKQNHHDNLLELDLICIPIGPQYYDNVDEFCYLLKYANNLFKLHYAYRNGRFFWAMHFFGPNDQASKFQYEIDIFDNSNSNLRVYVKGVVTGMCHKTTAFGEGQRFVCLCKEQIQDMITDDFTYRVRVLKA